ncbi:MAG: hypothetical protein K0V04_36775 [Deltaproteobacteria bacterium]|nr:hypothetical protein [Deltaproteobacteria bacterium]
MHRSIVPLLSALLLIAACDNAKTEARKGEGKTATAKKADGAKADSKDKLAKADKKEAKAEKAGDMKAEKAGDMKAEKADADATKTDDKTDEKSDADKAAERAKRMEKAYAELETWKTEEKTRWTDEIEAGMVKLVAADHGDTTKALAAILASNHRLPTNAARDQYRHPAETLAFFGVTPEMTVIEVGPGRGWYTEVLAPLLAAKGTLKVTAGDPNGDKDKGSTLYAQRFQAFAERSDAAFGKIERITQGEEGLDLGPDGSADVVFVARGLHGWVNREQLDANVAKVHAALKPGGVAAIVQHRAKDDAKPEESSKQGYLPQAWVVAQFEKAGFKLEEASEINANAKDTKDHPEGVWTLPPTLALGDKDKAKYEGIGESDRMTLRFRKAP